MKAWTTQLQGMVKDYENLFVIRSVTKFYGMAGIRFGYAVAAGNLIDKLETVRQPWSINGLAGVSYIGSLKRHRIHKEHQTNHRQRTAKHSPRT